jgi:beta-glucosidase
MRRVADPTHQLGIVLNLVPVDPATSSAADVGAATLIDGLQNRLFLDPVLRASLPEDVRSLFTRFRADDAFRPGDLERIAQPIDFLGVNYYFRSHVRSGGLATTFSSAFPGSDHVEFVEQAVQRTAAGFPIEPSGLFELLVSLRDDYGNPAVIVAENGAAFEDDVDGDDVNDDDRITFLADHILEIRNAIADGAKVRGYFVWTLMDNFEWSLGFTARYGLVRVERATGRRVEKASARWYRRLISAWRA